MTFNKQEKIKIRTGTVNDKKEVFKDKLQFQLDILKSASNIEQLHRAQGAAQVLEALISSFD
jgi:hypothetical protein